MQGESTFDPSTLTESIVLRVGAKDVPATKAKDEVGGTGVNRSNIELVFVKKEQGQKRRKDLSYLKVRHEHLYYFDITFKAGSHILAHFNNPDPTQRWFPFVRGIVLKRKANQDEPQSIFKIPEYNQDRLDDLGRPLENFRVEWLNCNKKEDKDNANSCQPNCQHFVEPTIDPPFLH